MDIEKIAKEAGFKVAHGSYGLKFSGGYFEKFARLVAEEEREACAMILDKGAALYREMKGNVEPVGVTAGDEECEELAYCCELNARYIRERPNV